MGLVEELMPGPVGLDTAIFIYLIERHPTYEPLLVPLFLSLQEGALQACTSSITLLELLVKPYQAGDADLAVLYEAFLTRSQGLTLFSPDRQILHTAAHLRAVKQIKTPDALQIATVLRAGCTSFLTNDRRLPAIPRLRIVQLADLT